MSKVVGIDLGTTNSCVAILENGEPVVIPNPEGSRTTPSVVGFTAHGERVVGQAARRLAATQPERTVYAVKRLMGQRFDSPEVQLHKSLVPYSVVAAENGDAWIGLDPKPLSPPEISAFVLSAMRATAEAYLGQPVTGAVVTVPAYFDDAQRQATKAAGVIAGLDIKRIINEPTAAALAYGLENKVGKRIAVYDLGGGTFDISVLDIVDGVFRVISTSGDTHLGGEDFDNLLVEHVLSQFQAESGLDLRRDRVALHRVKEECEKAKRELSSALETEINLPFIASDATGPKHLATTIRRNELERLVEPLVDRTLGPCKNALNAASITAKDIDEVVLVGGMTRMPLVQQRVTEFFNRSPNKGVNPDEVVAVGAAIQAAALSGAIADVLLLDVTPLSLGVETGGGVFYRLIPRNTTIPTRKAEIFTTSVDNQPFVPIHVLQGEREMAVDNKSLAHFELSPIPPAPRGVPKIEVTFDIDANGTVNVSAKDLGSGREQTVNVVASSGLTQDDILRIVSDGEAYKETDARRRELADLRNAADALIYTSERAVVDCAGMVAQEILDAVTVAIAALREAMAAPEPEPAMIRGALQQLELDAYRIAEAMYGPA